jgi:hypothetical protein
VFSVTVQQANSIYPDIEERYVCDINLPTTAVSHVMIYPEFLLPL